MYFLRPSPYRQAQKKHESADWYLQIRRFARGRLLKLGNSPHASQELHKPAITKGQGDDDVRGGDTTGLEVDGGEDESSQGEGTEAERGGVGELAALNGLVQTGLELTTKGREASIVAAVGVGERVAIVVVALGRLGIVMGAVGVCAGAVGDIFFYVCVCHCFCGLLLSSVFL